MIKRTLHACTTTALALAIAWAFGGCIVSKKQETVKDEPTVVHEKTVEVHQPPPERTTVIERRP